MCERFARKVPKGAESRRAQSPKMREVPKCAKSQTADDSGQCDLRPRLRHLAFFNARWDFAHYGISRTMGLRALWDLALYGTSRSMGLRALWDFALYGTLRPSRLI